MGEVLLDVPEHQCEIITHGRMVKLFAILSLLFSFSAFSRIDLLTLGFRGYPLEKRKGRNCNSKCVSGRG